MTPSSGLSALALLGGMGLAIAALPASAQQMVCDSNADGIADGDDEEPADRLVRLEFGGGAHDHPRVIVVSGCCTCPNRLQGACQG